MRLNKFKIGVLGGIGPEATAEFYQKLINCLQKRGLVKRNTDFPQIIINSIPAPELIFDRISEKDILPYVIGLKELDGFGVKIIVMVCNTIHLYYKTLQKCIKTPIIDLREELKNRLLKRRIKKVSVLGTLNTIKQGLYKFEGIKTINHSDKKIKVLSDAIFKYNLGINKLLQKKRVEKIARLSLNKGANIIILGCTEFAVMLEDSNLPTVNTIDVLVDSLIEKFRG